MTRIFTARNVSGWWELSRGGGMPSYSYHCQQCGKRFTTVEPISAHSDRKPACPKCGSKRVQRVFGAFFAKTSRKS